MPVRLTTAVVGAGPAGLLFCLIARVLHAGDDWEIRLFDKRAEYARTHRLRIDPAPFDEIRRSLDHPRIDALVAFLRDRGHAPAVNDLERHLEEAVASLGVRKEVFEVTDLAALRTHVQPAGSFTIVGADSVHSTVREQVRGPTAPTHYTHQAVARLRVLGPDLPDHLGFVQQYKLSKALGSILDYRLNPNGFGEVDLFLQPAEHAAVALFHATPADPIRLRASDLGAVQAPLFRRIVEHLEQGFGSGPCEVQLQSTFRLEHTVMPRRVFEVEGARVFCSATRRCRSRSSAARPASRAARMRSPVHTRTRWRVEATRPSAMRRRSTRSSGARWRPFARAPRWCAAFGSSCE